MKILAIETSSGRATVCLRADDGSGVPSMNLKSLAAGLSSSEGLVPLVGRLMDEAGTAFQALDLIAVCIGPGGFSGIRTGVAAARGIGLTAGVAVAGATSFRIMAAKFTDSAAYTGEPFGLCIPGGLGNVYCQIVAEDAAPIVALPLRDAASFFKGRVSVIAGDGAGSLNRFLETVSIAIRGDPMLDAAGLALMAHELDPEKDRPVPAYIRPADAVPQKGYAVALRPE